MMFWEIKNHDQFVKHLFKVELEGRAQAGEQFKCIIIAEDIEQAIRKAKKLLNRFIDSQIAEDTPDKKNLEKMKQSFKVMHAEFFMEVYR